MRQLGCHEYQVCEYDWRSLMRLVIVHFSEMIRVKFSEVFRVRLAIRSAEQSSLQRTIVRDEMVAW